MRLALAFVLALVLVVAGHAGPAQAFTAADFKGRYAFGFEGLENGDRVVSTGVMRLVGVGAVTGRASMRRDGGGECTGTIRNSTYSINADGTGFFALGFFPDVCAFAEAVPLSIAVFRSGRGFERASTFSALYSRTARLQVPPAP